MNGISLSQFPEFDKKWKLATVRYRADTGEMRFTYANDIAWQNMLQGKADYSDGAVFIKVGVLTTGDPAFASSKAPTKTRRYQVMARNRQRYAEHDGWGYALFDADGNVMSGAMTGKTMTEVTDACHICHKIVQHRGYVFSELIDLAPGQSAHPATDAMELSVPFSTVEASALPMRVQSYLHGAAQVRALEGELQQHLFQGTFMEIEPALGQEAMRTGLPAALVSRRAPEEFMIVKLDGANARCQTATHVAGKRLLTIVASADAKAAPRQTRHCEVVP